MRLRRDSLNNNIHDAAFETPSAESAPLALPDLKEAFESPDVAFFNIPSHQLTLPRTVLFRVPSFPFAFTVSSFLFPFYFSRFPPCFLFSPVFSAYTVTTTGLLARMADFGRPH